MAELLKGKAVADAISEEAAATVEELKGKGVVPKLAILRVGERDDDLAYERGAMKRCEKIGVAVKNVILDADVSEEKFLDALDELNKNDEIHGILMFQPLPKQISSAKAREKLSPEKDVDGSTAGSLAGVFINTPIGYPPCTAQAAMEILKHYNVKLSGKKAVVIGRSLVVGRPVANMLMHENATVTICHTKTDDVKAQTRDADIIIAASGQMESLDESYFTPGKNQVVIDVGIAWNESKGKLCGDVDFDKVEPVIGGITPVPGGVGAVTNSILVSHVVEAARRATGEEPRIIK